MSGQLGGDNGTVDMVRDCGNWTSGNCSTLDAVTGGPPGAWMISNLLLYALICAAGTVGNGLVIYVVLRSVKLSDISLFRSSQTTYMNKINSTI